MARQFIGPVINDLIAILKKYSPAQLAGLEPFVDFGKAFTGVVQNFPGVWVMPVKTDFDPEQNSPIAELHQVQIKFGITGSEPDELETNAVLYMTAVDGCIQAVVPADWTVVPFRVFVASHDYGPLFKGGGGGLAKFPELHLLVETQEL